MLFLNLWYTPSLGTESSKIQKRHEAQNPIPGQMPGYKTPGPKSASVQYTESILTTAHGNVKGNSQNYVDFPKFFPHGKSLTTPPPNAKIHPYVDVVELGSDGSAACGGESDLSEWQRSARDAGVRAKDIRRAPQQEDSLDLGAVTLVKVFPSRCHCEPVRTLVWQSVL